jgi:hypothetical protein
MQGKFPITGKSFRMEGKFLRMVMTEVNMPGPKLSKPASQALPPQQHNLSPDQNIGHNTYNLLSYESLSSDSEKGTSTNSAETTDRT